MTIKEVDYSYKLTPREQSRLREELEMTLKKKKFDSGGVQFYYTKLQLSRLLFKAGRYVVEEDGKKTIYKRIGVIVK